MRKGEKSSRRRFIRLLTRVWVCGLKAFEFGGFGHRVWVTAWDRALEGFDCVPPGTHRV